MDTQDLKKILATLSIAGLLTASIPITANCSSHEEKDKKDVQTEEATGEEKAEETDASSSEGGDESSAESTQSDEASSTGS